MPERTLMVLVLLAASLLMSGCGRDYHESYNENRAKRLTKACASHGGAKAVDRGSYVTCEDGTVQSVE